MHGGVWRRAAAEQSLQQTAERKSWAESWERDGQVPGAFPEGGQLPAHCTAHRDTPLRELTEIARTSRQPSREPNQLVASLLGELLGGHVTVVQYPDDHLLHRLHLPVVSLHSPRSSVRTV